MKILYVITKGSWGGAQKYVYDLAAAAHARGDEVAVACGEPGELGTRLAQAGVHVIPINSFARDISLFKEIAAFNEIITLLRRQRPDVLHVNSSKAGFIGTLAGRLCKIPRVIFTAHGWAFNEKRPAWQRSLFRLFHAITVGLSDTTICVSEAVKRDIETVSNQKKLVVIHNGIACGKLAERDDARRELAASDTHPFWIGIIAELHPTKQVDAAIDAFSLVRAEHPNAALFIIGDGEERERLASQIRRRGAEEQIKLLGFVPDAARFLKAFDLFLVPSKSEAFAYVILEAGCAELPVIASEVGGIPEVIENGVSGLLFPEGDVRKLAGMLHELILDASRRSAYAGALALRVRSGFTLAKMLEGTFALYTA